MHGNDDLNQGGIRPFAQGVQQKRPQRRQTEQMGDRLPAQQIRQRQRIRHFVRSRQNQRSPRAQRPIEACYRAIECQG